jgi:hypothetical protein
LLHNEKGKLVDVTPNILTQPGMITDAYFTDINNDGYKDLMVVGEWMPVTFFINDKGKFTSKQEVSNTSGWWNTICAADLDKDGDTDFVLGNWGLNSRFKASKEQPIHLYINDFDNNGTNESIITYYWSDAKSYLYPSKIDLTSQIPSLKKKFLYYKDFAGKQIEDVFGADAVKKSQQLQTQELRTAVLWNNGSAGMQLKPLPMIAQAAPVYAIVANDFDKDGNIDLLLAGNMYDVKPDVGRLDANDGIVLKGDGKGNFVPQLKTETGLNIKGQIRDAATIKLNNNKQAILIARNNDELMYLLMK